MRPAVVMVSMSCAAALIAVASVASAQGLRFGVKAGVTLAELHEDISGETTPFDFRSGLVAGGFVSWPLGSRLELQPEVLFTQKGAKISQGGGTLTQKLDYLDVPVLAG